MEGMLPGISSFQPRDMSFSGVNADTFSASIFTETFSLPSSKAEEMQIGHPLTSMQLHPMSSLCLYTLHLRCYNITTATWHKHHHLLGNFHNFHQFNENGMILSCSQHFPRSVSPFPSRPPRVSLHVHQSSRVVVPGTPEPNKGLEVWSPTGLAITPHRVAPKRWWWGMFHWQSWNYDPNKYSQYSIRGFPICKHSNKT